MEYTCLCDNDHQCSDPFRPFRGESDPQFPDLFRALPARNSISSTRGSGRNRIWRRLSVFCLLSVKVCSWYKTHSNTGNLAGVRYVSFVSVPGFHFGPVTVSFETFSGHTTMMYTMKVGFTIVINLIQYRGLDCHLIFEFDDDRLKLKPIWPSVPARGCDSLGRRFESVYRPSHV